jgi:hypothetical protein
MTLAGAYGELVNKFTINRALLSILSQEFLELPG